MPSLSKLATHSGLVPMQDVIISMEGQTELPNNLAMLAAIIQTSFVAKGELSMKIYNLATQQTRDLLVHNSGPNELKLGARLEYVFKIQLLPTQQSGVQPYGAQPYGTQPYGAQPYAQPYPQQPYGSQPYSQPYPQQPYGSQPQSGQPYPQQ